MTKPDTNAPAPRAASTSPFLASLSPDQRTIHDALCDSSYLAGAKAAWNASCEENPVTAREKFDALVKSRDGYLKEYSAALAALADAETAKAIKLGASVLARIEDPEARERCIRSALTVASQNQAPAPLPPPCSSADPFNDEELTTAIADFLLERDQQTLQDERDEEERHTSGFMIAQIVARHIRSNGGGAA